MNNKKESIKALMNTLTKELSEASRGYYNDSYSRMSDYEYDQKLKKLEALEIEHPEFKSRDSISPVDSIGTSVISNFNKKAHTFKMYSLSNTFNKEAVFQFVSRYYNITKEVYVEPKIDGVSIELYYNKGILQYALTRGDGTIGEDVTNNIKQINDIPTKIDYQGELYVRGEIYSTISNFNRVNALNENRFSNPRNFASGTIRQLDSNVVKERQLSAFLYWLKFPKGNNDVLTQADSIEFLKQQGFKTILDTDIKQTTITIDVVQINKMIDYYQELKTSKTLDFEIDGIVFKINDLAIQEQIGYNTKYPKWATSYKFNPENVITKLLAIEPTLGRTGLVTYNAVLEEVEIGQSKVSKATLHNHNYIMELDLRVGSMVEIIKAGEIIPKVVRAIKDDDFEKLDKWVSLTNCPICNHQLIDSDTGKNQHCKNLSCPSKTLNKLIHFVSKDAMDIKGLGESIITKLYDNGIISSIQDIYRLNTPEKIEQMRALEGFQDKSISNIIQEVEASKNQPVNRVLYSLGIKDIGRSASKIIFKELETIYDLFDPNLMTRSFIMSLEDFGETKTNSLYNWITNDTSRQLIHTLSQLGLVFPNPLFKQNKEQEVTDSIYTNKTIVITGSINDMNREQAKEYFESLGAIVKSSVSKKTDYLICGEKPSQGKIGKIDKDKIIYWKDTDRFMV